MTLAERVEASRVQQPENIVTLDIERIRGWARIPFWDLNSWKNRRIPADYVDEWPRTVCAAWRWYGETRIHFAAEWEEGGRQGFLQRVWDVYDRAHIVVGHNIDGFDTKKLKADWRRFGMLKPSPFKSVDTLKVARREWGFESNTLDSLCREIGLQGKVDHYDPECAELAVNGDKAAQRRLKRYNCGDIVASEFLYDATRGWNPSHPHPLNRQGEKLTCNECWGEDLHPNGYRLADLIIYPLYRCQNCGGNVQGSRHSRAAVTRGAR